MKIHLSDTQLFKFNRLMVILKNECWEWCGPKEKNYPKFYVDGKYQRAHRVIYSHFYGELSDYLEIDHLCCNTLCVNPRHLEAVTGPENRRRYKESLKAKYITQSFKKNKKNYCAKGHYTRSNSYCSTCNRLAKGKQPRLRAIRSKFPTKHIKYKQKLLKAVLNNYLSVSATLSFQREIDLKYLDNLDFSELK